MKKKFSTYISYMGGSTAYSGNDRIMYVNKLEDNYMFRSNIRASFGELPFKVVVNK